MADKETLARSLQEAREHLESALETAFRTYEQDNDDPLDLRVDVSAPSTLPDDTSERERTMHGTIRTLVDQFHHHPAVAESGLRVRSVTAMDSDADGTVAVNVSYEYPV